MEYSGTFFVNTNSDDDIIGIVFGYQSPRKFFVASWKKSTQIYWDTRPFRAKADSAFNIKVTWWDCPVLITSIRRENKLGYITWTLSVPRREQFCEGRNSRTKTWLKTMSFEELPMSKDKRKYKRKSCVYYRSNISLQGPFCLRDITLDVFPHCHHFVYFRQFDPL